MRGSMLNHKIIKKINKLQWLPITVFFLIAIAGLLVHTTLWEDAEKITGQDVYYTYLEGKRIITGENPYARILEGNMRENDKYATYFPLAYLLSSLTQLLGFEYFSSWLLVWRVAFLAANLGIAYLIFQTSKTRDQSLLGIFGALFWLFNRWTLHVTSISHLDFIPLFLLLLSLYLLPRRFYLACMVFGLSLAFKQIAIFALPLYLIWSWQTNHQNRFRHLFITISLISAGPFIVSIPFLIWNFEGFVRSILFSVTRIPLDHFGAPTVDTLLDFNVIWAKVPMLVLLGLAYLLGLAKRVPKYASSLLVMAVFFGFNSVLFRQYVIWFMPFIPLAVLEIFSIDEKTTNRIIGN